ncbi:hypothetical protein [Cloacibacillus evryensis]|uniref:hypothetical protein n=1 Tax=Cloacibacillus evryensis TaxID=508460 RepID=UPI002420293F|nr:hypothetical protein [Cloacibacillus evryensis]
MGRRASPAATAVMLTTSQKTNAITERTMPTMPQMMPLAEIARTSAGLTPDLARHSRTPSRTLLTKQLASISAHPGRG